MSRHPRAVVKRHRKNRPSVVIRTTLYELTETVIDTVGPDEKQSVTPVLLELLAAFCPAVSVVDA
ncbi:MAG: hypothetical protein WAM73_21420 [Desulfobacterales bacterium]